MKNNLVILDLETGGYDPAKNPITQIALQVIDPIKFEVLFDYDSFVLPYNDLQINKQALTSSRVSMQEINGGITCDQLINDLVLLFKAINKSGKVQTRPIIIGHNLPEFDIPFLEYLFAYKNKSLYDYVKRTTFDTLAMCKLYEADSLKSNENSKFTLTACCERLNIDLHSAHGAPADVEATKLLFIKLINLMRNADSSSTTQNAIDTHTGKRSHAHREKFHFEF